MIFRPTTILPVLKKGGRLTPTGESIVRGRVPNGRSESSRGESYRGDSKGRTIKRATQEETEIARMQREISEGRADVQGTRELFERRIKELQQELQKKKRQAQQFIQEQIEKVTPSKETKQRFTELREQRLKRGEPILSATPFALIDLSAEKFDEKIIPQLERSGLDKVEIKTGGQEIPLKQSISTDILGSSSRPISPELTKTIDLTKKISFSIADTLAFLTLLPETSTTAMASKGAGGTAQRVVQTTKKKKVDAKKLKDALKKLASDDLKKWREIQRQNIINNQEISQAEKNQRLFNLDAFILETKTNTQLFTESGAVDLRQLQRALSKTRRNVVKVPQKTKQVVEVVLENPPRNLKGIGVLSSTTREATRLSELPSIVQPSGRGISGYAGLNQYEKTELFGMAQQLSKGSVAKQKLLSDQINGIKPLSLNVQRQFINQQVKQLASQLSGQALTQTQINLQKNALRQRLSQALAQQSRLAQKQSQVQRQSLAQRSSLTQRQTQLQRQKSIQRGRSRRGRFGFSIKTKPKPKRRGRGLPFLLPRPNGKMKRIPTEITRKFGKYDVITFKGGKPKRLTKKPLSEKNALDFGAYRIGRTLRASFGLRRTSRKGLGKIPTEITGSFVRSKGMFRPSKNPKRKGFFVEKRKYRLDSPLEKKSIQQSRRRVFFKSKRNKK